MISHGTLHGWGKAGALVLALALGGCAAPAGLVLASAGTGVAMGTGTDYTLNGIAYKTFVAPLPSVRQAARGGLDRMGMKIVTDSKTDDGWTLSATAEGRTIDIDLERLTPRTTRMRVVASNGIIFKDRATEAAIIDEAADMLDRHVTAKN